MCFINMYFFISSLQCQRRSTVNLDMDESTTQYEEIDYSYLHLATIAEPQYLAMLESENNKWLSNVFNDM